MIRKLDRSILVGLVVENSKKVTILLSTYQGDRFLEEQLSSIAAQSYADWQLMWRDDGSSDKSVDLMKAFSAQNPGRMISVETRAGNLGAAESFMHLLAKAPADGCFAFCDQDDVWLPEKLSRSMDALRQVPDNIPAVYCSRQYLVDKNLKFIDCSQKPKRPPSFRNALVQNIVTGCTIVMNAQARSVILSARMPKNSMHDWWAYLAVTAAGGKIIFDDEPGVFYRQHETNAIGSPGSIFSRAVGAIRRGPGAFWNVFDAHLSALDDLVPLAPDARDVTTILRQMRGFSALRRVRYLCKVGLYRQGFLEDLALRAFVLMRSR
jgi:glycosyltransferase involved in cell wall biosynthesis